MTEKRTWLYDLLFILTLLLAGYLRLVGGNWGEGYHQHPDELFLTGVLDNLRAQVCDDPAYDIDACPQDQKRWMKPSEYFDTATSTLNPYNRGFAFFVYGNLPMTLTRTLAELTGNDAIGASKFFARQMSALADLFTIFLLYLFVSNLYGRRVGLFSAVFSALAVMQIQQSHFFTSDLFVNLFMFLALSFAVAIPNAREWDEDAARSRYVSYLARHPMFLLSLGFGVALGMAMASKINAAALAIVLPGAFAVHYLLHRPSAQDGDDGKNKRDAFIKFAFIALIAGGIATIVSFRIFQPYAFDGLGLNAHWVANIAEQRTQANGEADLPWNLQWARRGHLYSFTNLTVWGLGLPLGILAWAGFLLMGWRVFKGEWKHALLWGWTAFYFIWQSLQFNATMRYQLPIYPLLCMMAAWFVFEAGKTMDDRPRMMVHRLWSIAVPVVGVIVLVLTAIWAFAFQSIYLRDEPRMTASRWIFQNVPAPINIKIATANDRLYNQPLTYPAGLAIQTSAPYLIGFSPKQDGQLSDVTFAHAKDSGNAPSSISVSIYSASVPDVMLARASQTVDFASAKDPRGPEVTFAFDKPIPVLRGQSYILRIETLGRDLSLSGSAIANETDYDWGLPFRVDGYDPFGGMYRGDLLLQVYWDDNPDKLLRFVTTLNDTDYIIIPTNHQYGQITRLPERYPLTTVYYRELLGCPKGMDIIVCYRNAQVGSYKGRLGFELAAVFESYPTLGSLTINDQAAEEAFTFYDHPKVLIFKKSANYDPAKVQSVLGAVDLSTIVHLTPKQADSYDNKDLMLPKTRLVQQRAGGTWSELFDYDWIQNKYPIVGVLLWYAFIFLLGLVAYPIARLALPGLGYYAYPLSRIVGLVLLAWLSWMGGSIGIPYTRVSISVALAIVVVAGLGLGWTRRTQFKEEWNSNRRFFLIMEILFIAFFLLDLLIRLGNADMWHPAKGGERPMDFSYFNAVLKSESFPAYDPWFAGGYINYYYYGFVLAGTPVKLLGIVPSIAYNFILPTWFAMVAIGAFAIAFSIVEAVKSTNEDKEFVFSSPFVSGLAASFMTVLIGNLGTVRLLFSGFQRVAAPDGIVPVDATFIEKWILAFRGLAHTLTGALLPIGRGDWYWFPSRVIPAPNDVEPITEFPLFTFLYSDMHAHMLVMPITLFIIAWSVSFIKSRAQLTRAEWIAAFGIGALMIGALKPTNTWDLYTYFPLAALAVAYTLIKNGISFKLPALFGKDWDKSWLQQGLLAAGAVLLLYGLSVLFYYPFTYWYSQSYGKVNPWTGSHTPISSYLTQWGLFLFIIVAWLAWETREWMASTPVSNLKKLRPYSLFLEIGLALIVAFLAFFAMEGVRIGWLALPIAAWAGILLFRPNMPDVKRAVLMMVGTALVLTMAVELVVLVGDIGRMNTVFKLYLQAWMLLAVSAAVSFGWLINVFPYWRLRWRTVYQAGVYILLAGAFLFTLTASTDKISDRMTPTAPHTLDGMTFMNFTQHWDGQLMDLSQDYRAIRWMQDNIKGSPVIVEANCTEYRWCTRFTVYTGLPGVVGWNWHQRQQRGSVSPNLVTDRVMEIGLFYSTTDINQALDFLKRYQVKYIIVGQLERNVYPPVDGVDGIAKFELYKGKYWKAIYQDAGTTIYEVLP